jgi:hypothetical protein
MKRIMKFRAVFAAMLALGCTGGGDRTAQSAWPAIKDAAKLHVALPAEFGAPKRLLLAGMGWEDGLYVSRDGLTLYCLYLPADALAWDASGQGPEKAHLYRRGPTFGMDLTSPDPSSPDPWIHGDILLSRRASVEEPFPAWTLSGLARPLFSEGAPQMIYLPDGRPELLVFTSNDTKNHLDDLRVVRNPGVNPSGRGMPLPAPVNSEWTEDNPHTERIGSRSLVLFFESGDRPGGAGDTDLWFSLSEDNGAAWSQPRPVTSVNTPSGEIQPHLWHDGAAWWLYFAAGHTDGKLGIFRARQKVAGDWNAWGPRELVIGAGNAVAVGEPSLTSSGDLYFVVIYENPNGPPTDRYDCDPWFAPRKR